MTARRPVTRIGGKNKQLPASDTLVWSAAYRVAALSITRTSGKITSFTEDGVTTTITYNANGSVNTVSKPVGALTRTETYAYTDGVLTGMTATEV